MIGIMGAVNFQPAAFGKVHAEVGFANSHVWHITNGGFEITPDVSGHVIGGSEPPASGALVDGSDEDGTFTECGFAKATPAGDHAETGVTPDDLPLLLVGIRHVQFRHRSEEHTSELQSPLNL